MSYPSYRNVLARGSSADIGSRIVWKDITSKPASRRLASSSAPARATKPEADVVVLRLPSGRMVTICSLSLPTSNVSSFNPQLLQVVHEVEELLMPMMSTRSVKSTGVSRNISRRPRPMACSAEYWLSPCTAETDHDGHVLDIPTFPQHQDITIA